MIAASCSPFRLIKSPSSSRYNSTIASAPRHMCAPYSNGFIGMSKNPASSIGASVLPTLLMEWQTTLPFTAKKPMAFLRVHFWHHQPRCHHRGLSVVAASPRPPPSRYRVWPPRRPCRSAQRVCEDKQSRLLHSTLHCWYSSLQNFS